MGRPEEIIEGQILTFLEHIGWFVWKNQTAGFYSTKKKRFLKAKSRFQINGTSDILCVVHGRFVAIEVKTPKGTVTDDQRTFLARVNKEGGTAFVARSLSQAINQLMSVFPDDLALHRMGAQYILNSPAEVKPQVRTTHSQRPASTRVRSVKA